MKRFWRPPRRMQWRLTLSYTLITVVTTLLIELLTFLVLLAYFLLNQVALLENSVQLQSAQAVPYFVHGAPDRVALAKWLQVTDIGLPAAALDARKPGFLAVVDNQGLVVASRGRAAPLVDTSLRTALSNRAAMNLAAALRGDSGSWSFGEQESDGMLVLLAPIQESSGPVLGALVTKTSLISSADLFLSYGNLLRLFGINIVLLTVLAGSAGTLFGSVTARSFTRRFTRLSKAADNWSRGDFSAAVHDRSRDELGELSRRLNKMAEELHILLETRQQLATLEERNRLARDLHDSVKQQVFSLALQIGALKVLLRRDVDAAEQRLNEIARVVHLAQEELTSLIHELRPVALEGKNLASAIQDFAKQWEDQTWISAYVRVEGTEASAPGVEEALFRITQEALSNVARHSNAKAVQIQLRYEEESVTLVIADDGRGFDIVKAEGRGVGLLSMRERIQALGGDIQIESATGKGAEIRVRCCTGDVQEGK
ncbi:MAG TPA: sensor histidine kinase [Ktedonobacterales bacterium]